MNASFNSQCPIWGTPANDVTHNRASGHREKSYDSPRCGGKFTVGHTASPSLSQLKDEDKARLTTWMVDQRRYGNDMPTIDLAVLDRIATMPAMSVSERRDRLLLCLSRKSHFLGESIAFDNADGGSNRLELTAWTDAINEPEFGYIVQFANEEKLINILDSVGSIKITPKGYAHLDQLSGRNPDSAQAFVAMWFDRSMDSAYSDGFEPAIRDAGYKPLRIDRKEHINKIDDEIIAEIRRSRFLVADFTSEPDKPRGGVYFEAGFAQGLGIPVIWTCWEGRINGVHFDTRQFNHILWKVAADLRTKLQKRIEAVIGDGPLRGRKSE